MLELIKVSCKFLNSMLVDDTATGGLVGVEFDKCGPEKTYPEPDRRCDPVICQVVPCGPNSTVCDPQIEICYPHYDTP